MRWESGRQGTGYFKKTLLMGSWFDVYLIKYPVGSHLAPHIDPVPYGQDHYRINILVKAAKEGGRFYIGEEVPSNRFIRFFRPDQQVHGLTHIIKGTRYVLSIGWITKNETSKLRQVNTA